MIALLIGILILTGLYHFFYSVGQSNRLLHAESRMQENARLAFSIMTNTIQQAGNFGCQSGQSLPAKSIMNTVLFKPWQWIEGWEAQGTAYARRVEVANNRYLKSIETSHWRSTSVSNKPAGTKLRKQTDVLKVWYVKQYTTAENIQNDKLYYTDMNLSLDLNDIVVLNDCRQQVFAQVCDCQSNQRGDCGGNYLSLRARNCLSPGNQAFDLSLLNLASTEVGILEHAIFFVSQRASKYRQANDHLPSLYVRYLGKGLSLGNKQEIIEGVENLQFLYGEDNDQDGTANYYVSADQVIDWHQVVSIRVSLLLRSLANNLTVGRQRVYFNGAVLLQPKDDRYLRRVYSTTIKLRNRGE